MDYFEAQRWTHAESEEAADASAVGGPRSAGAGLSIHEERAGKLNVVVGRGKLSAFAVHVGLHVRDAVVRLFPGQVLRGKRENR